MGLKIEYLEETEDVYDITVENNSNFYANSILVHNCQEITLPTGPLNNVTDHKPEKKIIKMTKSEYQKYKKWKELNPNTPIKRIWRK